MFPHLLTLGSFSLPSYGALVALAFLVALAMASKFASQRGMKSETVVNLGVYCALAGMAGAKLLMIAMDPLYREHPSEIFSLAVLQSAGIFFGGFIASLLFAFFYMRQQGLPVLATSDIFAPGVALGHGIGRIGCFAAGCCWGRQTTLPWAVTFTSTATTTGVPLNVPLHPTQLYEAMGEAFICLALLAMLRGKHRAGQVIGMYLLLYGLLRFAVEFVRDHDASNPFGGPFVLEQWIALALAAGGVWLFARRGGEWSGPASAPAGTAS